jgi:hypothetical protein
MSATVVSFLFKIRKIRSVIRVRTYKPPYVYEGSDVVCFDQWTDT